MSVVVGEGILKQFGSLVVLKDTAFRIEDGDRIGVVGPNGEGKTTLLRILAREDEPTLGAIETRRGLRIGYLPQNPPELGDTSLWEAMLEVFAPLRALERELHELAERIAVAHGAEAAKTEGADSNLARLSVLQTEFEAQGGYGYEQRIKTVLSGLGFLPEQYERPLRAFSGGQRTRAYLARLLAADPDLLLLDEPTNHLDLEAVEWLEGWVRACPRALVVVSHDRYFLDQATLRTWEVAFTRLEAYRGGYSHYLRQREERHAERLAQWEAQRQHIEKTEEFIRRFQAGQRSKEARGRRTRLERFLATEAVAKPRQRERIRLDFSDAERSGDRVLRLRHFSAGYTAGKPLATFEDLDLWRGERVALVGPNGAGKTTVLRTILGQLAPLTGAVRFGEGVRIGYLSQSQDDLDTEWTVLQAVRTVREHAPEEELRTYLGCFLFSGDDVFKRVGQLSGGQRSRVALARIALQGANVLLLDEPTNHLDIPSQEALQEVLRAFPGTILFASHDRYLVQALATSVWAFGRGMVACFPGAWDAYLAWRSGKPLPAPGAESDGASEPPIREPPSRDHPSREHPSRDRQGAESRAKSQLAREEEQRATRRLKRKKEKAQARHQAVEQEIQELETKLKVLNEEIGKASETQELAKVRDLGYEYVELDTRLKGLWEEWTRLAEELEAAS